MIIKIEMGEGVVSKAPDIITTIGLGSCVVVVLYDAKRKIGGLAHVMLPDSNPPAPPFAKGGILESPPLKKGDSGGFKDPELHFFQYASTAVPALLDEMLKKGCSRRNIVARIAGGARMFSSYAEFPAGIGEQNIKSVRQLLVREGIPLMGFDVGGKHGRSVEFYLDSGRVIVKAFGREDREI